VKTVIAKTLKEALTALDAHPYQIVAGGTDLLIQNRSHTGMPIGFKGDCLYISLIDELNYIKADQERVYIGATTPLETILNHHLTPKLLEHIIYEMASPAIRHTGTLAGNIVNASPAGDSLVGLYLMDAKVKCQSLNKTRIVDINQFITGLRKTQLKANEMITEIQIPKCTFDHIMFKKVAPRRSDAISKLSFAGAVSISNQQIKDIRMAFGAVYITVVRDKTIEEKYTDISLEKLKASIPEVIKDYESLIQPIDDQRSNKVYRKQVALNLIEAFINRL